mmetsp:Transcript_3902/g.16218  ORF Transcript_3902/g.16218 Transcript_3902/m.16218 type:complete len:253 (-) Transcript_3902:464-1222(-)
METTTARRCIPRQGPRRASTFGHGRQRRGGPERYRLPASPGCWRVARGAPSPGAARGAAAPPRPFKRPVLRQLPAPTPFDFRRSTKCRPRRSALARQEPSAAKAAQRPTCLGLASATPCPPPGTLRRLPAGRRLTPWPRATEASRLAMWRTVAAPASQAGSRCSPRPPPGAALSRWPPGPAAPSSLTSAPWTSLWTRVSSTTTRMTRTTTAQPGAPPRSMARPPARASRPPRWRLPASSRPDPPPLSSLRCG